MQIIVNGQSYTRWEDVPPEVRQQLATTLPDADHDGIPDLFENAGLTSFTTSSIMVNGQPVQTGAQLSPELQAQLRQALGLLAPMLGATLDPTAPAAPAAPTAPLPPGQVMLNGVPTTVGETPDRKPWWKRLFGG